MKKILLVITGALCMMSCKKFLQEYSQTDLVPKTVSDYGEILYSDGYPPQNADLQTWRTFLDDDVQFYMSPANATGTADNLAGSSIFQWQPDFAAKSIAAGISEEKINTWEKYYHYLLGPNVVLQYIDNAPGAQTEREQFKGEAYALRAFYHFMLVNLYAKPYNDSTTTPDKSPGIPIRITANLTDAPLPRNSVKEVYNQITSDIDSAIFLLDKNKTTTSPFRISFVAAHLLASRIYLYMEQWDKVIQHADIVLAYKPMLMDLNTWGGSPDPDNKPVTGAKNVESLFTYAGSSEYSERGMANTYSVSADLASCYDSTDLRAQIFFFPVPAFLKPYFAPDYSWQKGRIQSSVPEDGISWRTAEAYLNRAEACIQQYKATGDASAANKALGSLNTLRMNRIDKSSFQPWTIRPADTLLQMCRTERRRELFSEENHRWMDLRRYGMPSITHIYMPDLTTTQVFRLKARDPLYVLPIPDDVIARNTSLVQNPVYIGTRKPE
ncbi:MAG: RagB/SusD family nutrient uptake outer membrane protein [Chitinophaga sp.]|uniref:RagB/SusD family nutrient uptake outer membrane protein n=1 Tax=Chitinophaga sp. TaxID=1869181 RepID=UPI001B082649|nr:RagB/SusD family nutrient uptake outer membrane protein [Chitinophaga sp.]MBO9732121.1 RagB/SusD family nutrient uptake outer membrane protein [Chitinophaga sp.]